MYLKSLDGVRFFAIISVLIFHIYEPWMPGGFLGVDLFFLISGFIITRNLQGQFEDRKFSFIGFYLKRIARLLPAASIVIALTLIASLYFSSEQLRETYAQTGIYAALSAVNIYFNLTASYFDQTSHINVFLHYWSLSVEEQFYIVWPILVLIGVRLTGTRSWIFMLAIAVIATGATWLWSSVDADDVFYLMPFRVFQFAFGAVCGLLFTRMDSRIAGGSFFLGLAVFLASIFLIHGSEYNFLTSSLIPTAAACLMLLGIEGAGSRQFLGNPVFRSLGLRAYSIYLVHWPIIVFTKSFGYSGAEPLVFIALFLSSIGLGYALNFIVEAPFRISPKDSPKVLQLKPALALGIVILAITVAAHVWIYSLGTQANDKPTVTASLGTMLDENGKPISPDFEALNEERFRRTFGSECVIDLDHDTDRFSKENCLKPGTEADILIVGASHARGTYMALSELYGEERIAMASGGGCDFFIVTEKEAKKGDCQAWNFERQKFLEDPQYEYIVVVTIGQKFGGRAQAQLRDIIERVQPLNKKVIAISPRLRLKSPIFGFIDRNLKADLSLDPFIVDYDKNMFEDVKAVTDQYDNAFAIDGLKAQCFGGCRAFDEKGNLLLVDKSHMSYAGAMQFARGLEAQITPLIEN